MGNPRDGLRQLHLLEDLFDHESKYRMNTPIDRPGRVLILSARDDRGLSPIEREALLATYRVRSCISIRAAGTGTRSVTGTHTTAPSTAS